jgi:hypothetical protein
MSQNVPVLSKIEDSWKQLLSFLPEQWEEKCKELGATKRKLRKFSGAEAILHTLLIHLLGGYSLRVTKAVAKMGAIADVSDVAVNKRLKAAAEWLRWMGQQMIDVKDIYLTPALKRLKMNIRLVDATHVSEAGYRGSKWRIHYAFDLRQLRCAEVKVTDYTVGEVFQNYKIEKNTLYIADRGLYQQQGIAYVVKGGGDVLVRMKIKHSPLHHPDGTRFGLLSHLRSLKGETIGDWPVFLKVNKQRINGRICAVRKSRMAAHHAKQELIDEYHRKGKRLTKIAVEATKYVFVFTTLSVEQLPAADALQLYRGRWQIELVFKRMKSILGLGHLHRKNPQGAVAWLQGKLLCALLIEKLLTAAELFPPQYQPPIAEAA